MRYIGFDWLDRVDFFFDNSGRNFMLIFFNPLYISTDHWKVLIAKQKSYSDFKWWNEIFDFKRENNLKKLNLWAGLSATKSYF